MRGRHHHPVVPHFLRSRSRLIVAGQQEWNVSGRFYLRRDVPLLVRPETRVRELDGALTFVQE